MFRDAPYLILVAYLINLLFSLVSIAQSGWPGPQDPVRHYLAPIYDPIYITLQLALLIMIAAMGYFFRRIGSTFEQLWQQGVIHTRSHERVGDFQARFERWLNHRARWLLGGLFGILALPFVHNVVFEGDFSYYFAGRVPEFASRYVLAVQVSDYINALTIPVYLFVLGSQIWRMIVTAVVIRRIPVWFDVNMQPAHPDRCGGFKALGDLCLAMVYVLLVPAAYLGFWLVVGRQAGLIPSLEASLPVYAEDPAFLLPIFALLILIMAASLAGFFWPLWTIHEVMLAEREELQRVVDEVARRIHTLEERTIAQAGRMSVEDREKAFKEIESLTKLYERNRGVPTWPFERSSVAKLVTAQAIPVISMFGLTGPASAILKLVGSLFSG